MVVGCILSNLNPLTQALAGHAPFEASGAAAVHDTLDNVVHVKYSIDPTWSLHVQTLLQTLLVKDPKARASLEDVGKHAFFLLSEAAHATGLPAANVGTPPLRHGVPAFRTSFSLLNGIPYRHVCSSTRVMKNLTLQIQLMGLQAMTTRVTCLRL